MALKTFHHNQYNYNQPHNNDLLHDAQGRWQEISSTTQVLTEEQQLQLETMKRKKEISCKWEITAFQMKMSSTWLN